MIFKAKHHLFLYPFFKWYSKWIMKRHFGTINILGDWNDQGLPVLLLANHISWWDGFWAMYLNLKVLNRKFHFMVMEEQLRKHLYFNEMGGFSVNKKSRSVLETLNYTSELLGDRKNVVLVFPQGEIQSMHEQDIQFEKGVERILKNKKNDIQILFVANLTDYFSQKRPGLYMHLQEYAGEALDMQSIQQSYQLFYAQSLEKQKQFKNKQ